MFVYKFQMSSLLGRFCKSFHISLIISYMSLKLGSFLIMQPKSTLKTCTWQWVAMRYFLWHYVFDLFYNAKFLPWHGGCVVITLIPFIVNHWIHLQEYILQKICEECLECFQWLKLVQNLEYARHFTNYDSH